MNEITTVPLWKKEPHKYRRGLGLYVKFREKETMDLFPVDEVGGESISYTDPNEIVIRKQDPDGTERRVIILKMGVDWMQEHAVAIRYASEPRQYPSKKAVKRVQSRSRVATSPRR